MSVNDLIAGEERFKNFLMEDETEDSNASVEVEADIKVAVDDSETIPEEEAEEAQEVVEETTEEVEELLGHLDLIERYEAATREFGWSKTIAAIADPTGTFMAKYAPEIPAMESLDPIGSASSHETIAALEGFKTAAASAWKWIKEMCAKIAAWVKTMYEKVKTYFTSQAKNVTRIKDLVSKADINDAKLGECTAKVVSAQKWEAASKEIVQLASSIGKSASTESLKALGISKTGELKDKFVAKEGKLKALGWDKNTVTNLGGVALSICRIIDADLSKFFKFAESEAKRLNGVADKYKNLDKAEAKEITSSKEELRLLNNGVRVANSLNTVMSRLVKEYIRAGLKVYSCRGGKEDKKA